MPRLPRVPKRIEDAEPRPDALTTAVPHPHARDFAWICAFRLSDGTRVDLFVHSFTERILLLGDDGASFNRTQTGRFKEGDLARDVEFAIPHRWQWLEMGGYPAFEDDGDPWEGYYGELAS